MYFGNHFWGNARYSFNCIADKSPRSWPVLRWLNRGKKERLEMRKGAVALKINNAEPERVCFSSNRCIDTKIEFLFSILYAACQTVTHFETTCEQLATLNNDL